MRQLLRGRSDQLLAALVITMVLMGLVALVPAVAGRLHATPSPTPTPSITPPPQAVLLPDELAKALDGVMTLANDQTFGTAFLIDSAGDFLTASSLVDGAARLRLVDNTGGTHQVRLIGLDPTLGVAMVRAAADGTPIIPGDSSTVQTNAPIVLLASPKVENLSSSSSGTVSHISDRQWTIQVDDLPGNIGGPVVGPGAKVLGLLIGAGTVVPINTLTHDLASWRGQQGTLVGLAPFPAALVLRGSETTTTPTSGASMQSVSPRRVSTGQAAVITIQGSGFVAGSALAVRFMPLAGSNGAFSGLGPALVNASTVTVKVPAGELVQDYVIELINGDGSVLSSRLAFTVTP